MMDSQYIDEYHSDDDTYSIGGDSGFSVGKQDYDDDDTFKEDETPSFFARVASIPLIQDSVRYVQKNRVGKKALAFAETNIPTVLSQNAMINSIGNKSLDIIERQFPMIVRPTDELVTELQTQKSNMINPSIHFITDHLEFVTNRYLPDDNKDAETDQKQGLHRLLHAIHILSLRTSKLISDKMTVTVEEERQLKKIVQDWMTEQVAMVTEQQQAAIQLVYEFATTEVEKFRLELCNKDISHVDRMRNILALSQTDILAPLYQKLILFKHQ